MEISVNAECDMLIVAAIGAVYPLDMLTVQSPAARSEKNHPVLLSLLISKLRFFGEVIFKSIGRATTVPQAAIINLYI
jgi:hypothetical protein